MRRPDGLWRWSRHAAAVLAAVFGATVLASQSVSAVVSTECTVTPRSASEFVLPTDPAVAGGDLPIVDDEAQLPTGTPAIAADVMVAQAFAELYTACKNAGDLRQISALYSDTMFRNTLAARMSVRLPPENPLQALLSFFTNPVARDRAEEAALLARDVSAPPIPLSPPITDAEVRDVRVLPDGRLGAILVQDSRPTEFQIYARADGRFLLDERMDLRLTGLERPETMTELPDAFIAMGSAQADCAVAPIELPAVEATFAALPPEADVVDDVVSVDDLPQGSPASQEIVDAVAALEHEFVACLNQGDRPRVMALLTGSGLRTLVEATGLSAAELYRATPAPPSADVKEAGRSGMLQVAEVRDVRVLDDGRIGAIVVWDDPESPGLWTETLFHIYERVEDRLLLDEEIVVSLP